MRILLVQDNADLATGLINALAHASMSVEWTNNGIVALKILSLEDFDAAVIDLDMPDRSGNSMLSHLKASRSQIPVIVLTAHDTLAKRVACFNAGADDFLAKPFAVEELQARLRAVIRRGRNAEYRAIACGPLAYDVLADNFTLHGDPLALSRREHALLYVLIRRTDRYLPKQMLFDRAFGGHENANLEAIEVLVHRLRKKLAGTPVRITSARGFGYRLEMAADDEGSVE
jgi:two-component system response regulator TctD